MGLDARVYCDCIETGYLLVPHPFPDRLSIASDGGPDFQSDDLDELLAHDAWLYGSPCRHEACGLVSHWLGNIALVAGIRFAVQRLSSEPECEYPVLWSQIIYSGTHCGDYLTPPEVSELETKIGRLRTCDFGRLDVEDAEYLRQFLAKLDDLIQASRMAHKPIVF